MKPKKKDRIPLAQKAIYAVCAISILASGYGFSEIQANDQLFSAQYAENEALIRQKTNELSQLQEYTPEDLSYVQSNMQSASDAGSVIANLQMSYWTAEYDDLKGIKSQIQEKLALGARGSEIWYSAGSAWPDDFTWRFESNYDFAGNMIPVIWTCWDLKDKMVCYASAEYDAMNGVFSDITVTSTLYGRLYEGYDTISTRPEDFENLDLEGLQNVLGIDAEALQNGDVEKGFGIKLKEGFNEDGSLWEGWTLGPDGNPQPPEGYTGQDSDEDTDNEDGDAGSIEPEASEPDMSEPDNSQGGFTWEGDDINE